MEYYSATKNEDILSFAGKWMELENITLSEVTQTQKDMCSMCSLISRYQAPLPPQKKEYRIPKIQSTELEKINKPKGPSNDSSIPLGRKKKAITRGDLGGKGDMKGKRGTQCGIGKGLKSQGPAERMVTGNLRR